MGKSLKEILAKSIQLASKVTKAAGDTNAFKPECSNIKLLTEKLAQLLGKIPEDIEYDRPFLRIMAEVEKVLDKALSLVLKCATSTRVPFLASSPGLGFTKIYAALESCFADVNWLFNLLESDPQILSLLIESYPQILSLRTVASNARILACTWSYIAGLYHSLPVTQHNAALELLSLSRDCDGNKKMIIEEGGVFPLLKILKHGEMQGQELAIRIFWNLGHDSESVVHIIDAGVFSVFAEILKEGPMKVQAVVASAVSKFADVHPRCQDICVQTNIVRILINHLSFETIHEHVQNYIPMNKATSILAIVKASSRLNKGKAVDYNEDEDHKYTTNHSHSNESCRNKHLEDPNTKAQMKAMAAKALWQLVKGNITICRIITESRALMCFITLLAKGPEDVQYASIMALMEITAIAEQDADLKRSTFKPSSPAWKAVIEGLYGLYRTIQTNTDSNLLIPSIKAIGNLARTFRVTNLKIISSLVELIDVSKTKVVLEALNALKKFCNRENHLHSDNCKSIISIGGVRRLAELASMEESTHARSSALFILRCIAMDVPGDRELVDAGVHTMLVLAPR